MRYGVMERYPLQSISFDDIQAILTEAGHGLPKCRDERAAAEWPNLSRLVSAALRDAFLLGSAAGRIWLPVVEDELARIRAACSPPAFEEIYVAFLTLLDRVYGALHRHALRHLPTALVGGQGHFRLERLRFVRSAYLPGDAGKAPLQSLMEFIWQGGPRIEVEFVWEPMGKGMESRPVLERHRQAL